jgi:crotonobetainyl-CoA:carnitine CoA-transferase CaiB-like acyl-CoA transferase
VADATYLGGLRVVEVADEQGEYGGRLLASLGAEVIKVEPPGGSPTRWLGPFADDEVDPERSLYFWHYNLGKRSVVLDLDDEGDQARFAELVEGADVLLESCPLGWLDERGLGFDALSARNPSLVQCSVTPFGTSGPWAGYQGSDLVHLALGGQMMYCGYGRDIHGEHDTPPIAAQMWQAFHMAGDHAAIATMAALLERDLSGQGQCIDVPIHQVVATNTELDVPNWIYLRNPMSRSATPMSRTKDGRGLYTLWAHPPDGFGRIVALLDEHGLADDLADEKYLDPMYRFQPDVMAHIQALVDRFVSRYRFEGPWHEAQAEAILWAPMRKPEENLDDENWAMRQTFAEVEHPERGESYRYLVGRWYSEQATWTAVRAPHLGEHTDLVLGGGR